MNRPNTARELAQALEKSPVAHHWTVDDGELWWGQHQRRSSSGKPVADTKQEKAAFDQTIDL
jgi:hypothetical protein